MMKDSMTVLLKRFSKATGKIVSYINAGDFYYKNAFSSVVNFLVTIKTLTGSQSLK